MMNSLHNTPYHNKRQLIEQVSTLSLAAVQTRYTDYQQADVAKSTRNCNGKK